MYFFRCPRRDDEKKTGFCGSATNLDNKFGICFFFSFWVYVDGKVINVGKWSTFLIVSVNGESILKTYVYIYIIYLSSFMALTIF